MIDIQSTSALRRAARKTLPSRRSRSCAACTSTGTPTHAPDAATSAEPRGSARARRSQRGNFAPPPISTRSSRRASSGPRARVTCSRAARLVGRATATPRSRAAARRRAHRRDAATAADEHRAARAARSWPTAGRKRRSTCWPTLQPPLAGSRAARRRRGARPSVVPARPARRRRARARRARGLARATAAAILANQRMIWDGFRQYPPPATPVADRRHASSTAGSRSRRSRRAARTDLRRSLLAWRQTYTDHPAPRACCSRSCWPRNARRRSPRRSRCCCR